VKRGMDETIPFFIAR